MVKRKDRLYATLCHRYDEPGSDWAFVLSPADGKRTSKLTDEETSTAWDITYIPPPRPDDDDTPSEMPAFGAWAFRTRKVPQHIDESICARVLLAKIPSKDRAATLASFEKTLSGVEIEEDEFGSGSWALRAVKVLVDQGVAKLRVEVPGQFGEEIKVLGEDSMVRIRNCSFDVKSDGVAAIPTLDLRKK